ERGDGFVARRKQHPVTEIESVSGFQNSVRRRTVPAQVSRANHSADVFRVRRNAMLIVHHVNGNSPAAKAASHPKSRVVASDDQSAYRLRLSNRDAVGILSRVRVSGAHADTDPRFCETYLVNAPEANSVPATKYSSGPKLFAAAAPMKCK